MTSFFVTLPVPIGKPSSSSAHAFGSAIVANVDPAEPARLAMNDGPIAPRHRIALCSDGLSARRASSVESLDGVDRPENLGQRRTLRVEAESHAVALALQSMHADGETVTIDLVAMQQSWLHDALAATDLVEQTVHVGYEIVVDVGQVRGDHGAEQEAAESRRRIDGQHEVAERYATRRSDRDANARPPTRPTARSSLR